VTETTDSDYLRFFRMTARPRGWFVFRWGHVQFDVLSAAGAVERVVGFRALRDRLGVKRGGRRDFQECMSTCCRLFRDHDVESWVNWPYGGVSSSDEVLRG
jgi:hypothetical protein